MGVPVGCGFGASAAASISAVYAAAGALGLRLPRRELAYHAHVAEILRKTGLGTASVAYDATGAGVITVPGGPGISKFLNVRVPPDTKIVTASLGPFRKSGAISNPDMVWKINKAGLVALRRVQEHPTLDMLASQGEWFSENVGLMSPEVKSLAETAISAGASHASQNMIGHAIHAIVDGDHADRVARALKAAPTRPRVDVFEVGRLRAHVISKVDPATRR